MAKSKGLGDTVAKVTKATGIDKAVKTVFGEDCGCDERREVLNRLFPYTDKNQLTADDVEKWRDFKNTYDQKTLHPHQQDLIIELINKLGYAFSGCKSCNLWVWKRHIDSIDNYVKNICDGSK